MVFQSLRTLLLRCSGDGVRLRIMPNTITYTYCTDCRWYNGRNTPAHATCIRCEEPYCLGHGECHECGSPLCLDCIQLGHYCRPRCLGHDIVDDVHTDEGCQSDAQQPDSPEDLVPMCDSCTRPEGIQRRCFVQGCRHPWLCERLGCLITHRWHRHQILGATFLDSFRNYSFRNT